MLNNPSWDKTSLDRTHKTNIDDMNKIELLEALAAWLATKCPDEKYEYTDNQNCMCCQFFRTMGMDIDYVDSNYYALKSSPDIIRQYPRVLNSIAYGRTDDYFQNKNTFGRALLRTENIINGCYDF